MGFTLRISIVLQLFICYKNIQFSTASPLMGENVVPAKENEFPFIVSLDYFRPSGFNRRYKNHFCGGSLISKRHVLTSEHCIAGKKPFDVIVSVGTVDLNKGRLYGVKFWTTYNEWAMENNIISEYYEHDIAIITLSKDITNIVPAKRANLADAEVFGKNVTTAGWGIQANKSRTQFLQKVESLRVLTPEECKRNMMQLFELDTVVPHNHYCTYSEAVAILSCGDSGGPLLLADTKEIVGINDASCKVKDAWTHPYATSIHLKVNYFKDFIDDVTK